MVPPRGPCLVPPVLHFPSQSLVPGGLVSVVWGQCSQGRREEREAERRGCDPQARDLGISSSAVAGQASDSGSDGQTRRRSPTRVLIMAGESSSFNQTGTSSLVHVDALLAGGLPEAWDTPLHAHALGTSSVYPAMG